MKKIFISCFDIGEVPRNPGKWMQRSQADLYVHGKNLKYWAVLDLARLAERDYWDIVKNLVTIARGVS